VAGSKALEGKVVVVTGGARGIGAACARLLHAAGARVVVADLLDDLGREVADQVGGLYVHLDVTREDDWSALTQQVRATFGGLDALVNNAGVLGFSPVGATALEEWNRIIAVNLTGVFLGMEAVVPDLRAAGGGVIVNISSTAGIQGYGGLAPYVASKWGVRGLTKAAALDLASDRIRVVSVHPGGVRTPMTDPIASDAMYAQQPIPRIGEPDEIARLVVFLIAEATYSTGTEFIADGGATVGQVLDL
jgi:3alpha(or 20beta)-hydroxysteroid dehydrogenase